MLIQKKTVSAGDIVSLRLVSGEEVVAKLKELTDKSVVLTKPVSAQLVMNAPGQGGVVLMPFMLTIDEKTDIEVGLEKVVAMALSRKEAKDQYITQTSGLAVASNIPNAPLR
jgi:hypothetical protein